MRFKNAATCGVGFCTPKTGAILREKAAGVAMCLIVGIVLWIAILCMAGALDPVPDSTNLLVGLLTADKRKRLPPYAKQLKAGTGDTLWICTGTEAWARAKSTTWMNGKKVVLPPGDDPDEYRWNVAGRFEDVVIVVDGRPPSTETIKSLAIALLSHSDIVVYLDPKRNPVRFKAGRCA